MYPIPYLSHSGAKHKVTIIDGNGNRVEQDMTSQEVQDMINSARAEQIAKATGDSKIKIKENLGPGSVSERYMETYYGPTWDGKKISKRGVGAAKRAMQSQLTDKERRRLYMHNYYLEFRDRWRKGGKYYEAARKVLNRLAGKADLDNS